MKNTKLKVGTILIAIDSCAMYGTDKERLTVGKEYIIKDFTNSCFIITDDTNKPHYFTLKKEEDGISWKTFFKIKSNE